MRTSRRTLALLLLAPAFALGACGGESDEDKIVSVIQDVAKDSSKICEHASDKLLAQLGGDEEKCKEAARGYPDESSESIDADAIDVKIDGETATADFTDNDGDKQHVTFVKDGDHWLVDASETR